MGSSLAIFDVRDIKFTPVNDGSVYFYFFSLFPSLCALITQHRQNLNFLLAIAFSFSATTLLNEVKWNFLHPNPAHGLHAVLGTPVINSALSRTGFYLETTEGATEIVSLPHEHPHGVAQRYAGYRLGLKTVASMCHLNTNASRAISFVHEAFRT